jgi:hypothetical protein
MPDLSNWENIVVIQRRPNSGCVPTCYEWLIRYLRIQGVNLETFQEDYDLGREKNNFESVSEKVKATYPFINFHIQRFEMGLKKVNAIRSLIEKQIPCLISLSSAEIKNGDIVQGDWHIMPVVYIDDEKIKMIHKGLPTGTNDIWEFPLHEIVWRHHNLKGGNDISWITV